MSYLRRAKASCGRHTPKPNESEDNPNFDDETSIPIQDQIDNLRAKISLKEKYNKALMEEVSETNSGAATMIVELVDLNKQLHIDLEYEKNAEKFAVKKALRSYRLFQLAVTEKDADSVVEWLDDKIFDASKTLNEGIFFLKKMQNKLQEAEVQVFYMESCPVPGSEPWERKAEEERARLECAIEATKANRDAALLLNKKYRDILFVLKGERGKWPHTMALLEKTLALLRRELNGLENMLEDAHRFRDEAHDKLKIVEEEASINRKQRRTQMSKMKKSVEKALEANTAKYATEKSGRGARIDKGTPSTMSPESALFQQSAQEIKIKMAQVQDYENRGNKLVEIMRVKDLRFCPKRLRTVRRVTDILNEEHYLKEDIKQFLLKHKYRLELIVEYFRYTGTSQGDEFLLQMAEKQEKLHDTEEEIQNKAVDTDKKGAIFCDLRLSLVSLEEILFHGKKKREAHTKQEDMRQLMKKLGERVKVLVENVDSLKQQFPEDSKPVRSYAPYIKHSIPHRYIRMGGADDQDLDDDSDQDANDLIDSKIPSREEIKSRSEKIYSQAMLRRGLK